MFHSGGLTRLTLRVLDSLARGLPGKKSEPEHLKTGRLGEEEAYFHLRRLGYTIVARNHRSPYGHGELDLVGWEGGVLCFIEVKTRTSYQVQPAEAAVDHAKQRELSRAARQFLRKIEGSPPFRFDIVSIYLEPHRPPQVQVFQDAFPMS